MDSEATDHPQRARAAEIVYRQLAVRDRTRAELERTLSGREIPAEVTAEVLDAFERAGLVDDARFAAQYMERSRPARGLSRRGAALKLKRAGVDPAVVAQTLQNVDEADERAVALELARKKARTTRGLEPRVRERRIAAALARRGFTAGLVLDVTRAALQEERSD